MKQVLGIGVGDTPRRIIEDAQVAFVNDGSWGVVAHNMRFTALSDVPFPKVNCPIVLTVGVNDEAKMKIVHRYIEPLGVTNLELLLSGLERIGCVIAYSSDIPTYSAS